MVVSADFARQLERDLNQLQTVARELAKPVAHTANSLNCHCFDGTNTTIHKSYCNIGSAIKALTAYNNLPEEVKGTI